MTNADLTGAKLGGANLTNAILTNAKFLLVDLYKTTMPDGTLNYSGINHPSTWPFPSPSPTPPQRH